MEKDIVKVKTTRYDYLPMYLKVIFIALTVIGISLSIFYLFGFSFHGKVMLSYVYYFALYACFCSCSFILKPARDAMKYVPWYDLLAAILVFILSIYFMMNGWDISEIGWGYPTTFNFILAIIYAVLLIEGARRISGPYYVGMCVFFGLYPMFAEYMPGFLYGTGSPFLNVVGSHVFGGEGILGFR